MSREVTHTEGFLVTALLVLGVCLTLACTGCSTARQGFYAGQGLDVATTAYGLNNGFVEANPLADDMQDVLILKAGLVLLVEGIAHLDPDHADIYYTIGAVGGAVAGGVNLYTIGSK